MRSTTDPPKRERLFVVALAAFLSNLLAGGFSVSYGIFLDRFLVDFQRSKLQTTFVASILLNSPLILGPWLTGPLIARFGIRFMCISGGVLLCIGNALGYFAESLVLLYFSSGIVSGSGLAFAYVSTATAVEQTFGRRYSFLAGLTQCGNGVGAIVFANVYNYLLRAYERQGALLICGGILLNLAVCGALFRVEPPDTKRALRSKSRATNNDSAENMTKSSPELQKYYAEQNDKTPPTSALDHARGSVTYSSLKELPTFGKETRPNSNEQPDGALKPAKSLESLRSLSRINPIPDQNTDMQRHVLQKNFQTDLLSVVSCPENLHRSAAKPKRLAWDDGLIDYSRSETDILTPSKRKHISVKPLFVRSHESYADQVRLLCRKPPYVIFSVSSLLFFAGAFAPMYFYPNHARDIGIEEGEAAMVVGIVGLTNIIGQILYGVLADKPKVDVTHLYAWVLCVHGVTIACIFLSSDAIALSINAAFYGFNVGVNWALGLNILATMIHMKRVPLAFNVLSTGEGIAGLVGVPLTGLIRDVTGSYKMAFVASGVCVAVSGLLMFAVNFNEICVRRKSPRTSKGRRYPIKQPHAAYHSANVQH